MRGSLLVAGTTSDVGKSVFTSEFAGTRATLAEAAFAAYSATAWCPLPRDRR